MPRLHAAILAGGAGTRFWPLSRRDTPKQLLTVFGTETLLAATVHRIRPLVGPGETWIATGANLAARVAAACPDLPAAHVLAEPVPRDSAGAIVLATAAVAAHDPDATVAILPSDHVIASAADFQRALRAAQALAEREQALATFGIPPTRPETGYGYIRRGEALGTVEGVRGFRAAAFVEKPDRATAARHVAAGDHLWNAGIFVLPLPALRAALARHLPAHAQAFEALAAGFAGGGAAMVCSRVFPGLPKVSFDYGIMEKAERVVMCEAPFAWDDVGAWPALLRVHPPDAAGNVGRGPVVLHESAGTVAVSDGPVVAAFGLHDHLVVAAGGAVLVCPLDRAADLKQLLARLEREGHAGLL